MFWVSVFKDLMLVMKEKMFWIVEILFVLLVCFIAIMLNTQINRLDINKSVFELSFPLTMSYAILTFTPVGDYHREQRNGCFFYLMATGMSIKKYIISKGVVLGIMIYIPSLIFLLLLDSTNIFHRSIVVVLMLLCAFNMSLWYAYEIIYSINPMKTMGKASMLAMGFIMLFAVCTRINNYINNSFLIILLYIFNIGAFFLFLRKLKNLYIENIICRR